MAQEAEYANAPVGLVLVHSNRTLTHLRAISFRLSVKLDHHNAGKPCFVRAFIRRQAQGTDELSTVFATTTGAEHDSSEAAYFTLHAPHSTMDPREPLYFWIHADRKARGDFAADEEMTQMIAYAGRARVAASSSNDTAANDAKNLLVRHTTVLVGQSVCNWASAMTAQSLTIPIFDIKQREIGSVTLTCLDKTLAASDEHLTVRSSDILTSAIHDNTALVDQFDHDLHELDKTTPEFVNTRVVAPLPRRIMGSVELACGKMPMWSMPWMLTQRTWDNKELENTLLSHVAVAESAMFCPSESLSLDPTKRRHLTKTAEFICEMQLATIRSFMYTPDTVLSAPKGTVEKIDMWEYVNHQPDSETRRMDCEDGAIHLLEWHLLLTSPKSKFQSKLLQQLQEFERQYVGCLVVGTMRTGPGTPWFYHVWAMKFDRCYLQDLLACKTSTSSQSYMPTVLVESTTYVTGCWTDTFELGPNFGSEEIWMNSQIVAPVENFNKAPAHAVRQSGNYGLASTLIAPELMASQQIAQIELAFNGKRCVPVEYLMDCELKGITAVPVKASNELLAHVYACYDHMPTVSVLHTDMKAFEAKRPKSSDIAKPFGATVMFSAWYRLKDWQEPSVQAAAKNKFREKLGWQERVFDLGPKGGRTVHVVGYRLK